MNDYVIEMDGSNLPAGTKFTPAVITTPASLLQIAVQRGASIPELTALMDLQERYEATQARKAYVEAMASFKKNAPEIYKEKNVSFSGTSYNHATLGNICDVVIESLAKHGISHRWDTEQPANGMIIVKCILTHSMGHSEATQLEAPPDNSGKKNNIQQLASTVTYLQRYTLLAACGLSTKDMPDDDGRGATREKEVVKSPISGKAFEKCLASIRNREYCAAEIFKFYELTTDQRTAVENAEKESA